jgi:hypothetical protein
MIVLPLTDVEKLAALETYVKTLKEETDRLRAALPKDMAARHIEKVGAYLPDGTKMASVALSDGRITAKVTDEAAALRWCLKTYPDEVEVQTVQTIRPAFLKMLTESSKAEPVGPGVDRRTGEALPFIEVTRGNPFIVVTTTEEGVSRMRALADGFAGMMLEAPAPAGGTIRWADGEVTAPDWTGADAKPGPGQGAAYDPGFADRLENGASSNPS